MVLILKIEHYFLYNPRNFSLFKLKNIKNRTKNRTCPFLIPPAVLLAGHRNVNVGRNLNVRLCLFMWQYYS
nr:MAG TPA: hypothetical protein [Caudoviricetes sp.]